MFPAGVERRDAAALQPQADRQLIGLFVSGTPGVAGGGPRLWQTHPAIFEEGGGQADLPAGWEQRVDRKSGRIFFVNHNSRTTCWTDPRTSGEPQVEQCSSSDESDDDWCGYEENANESAEEEYEDDVVATPSFTAELTQEEVESSKSSANFKPSVDLIRNDVPGVAAAGSRANSESRGAACGLCSTRIVTSAHKLSCSELRLFGAGLLHPTVPRLARHAVVQRLAAEKLVFRMLPEASSPVAGVRPRGFALLQQRRFRLLQHLHIALLREAHRSGQPRQAWQDLYKEQMEQQGSNRSSKTVQKALESLARHSQPNLVAMYTSWFKTRSHLARCNSVLHRLAPLQLSGLSIADTFSEMLVMLQHKLLVLAHEQPKLGTHAWQARPASHPSSPVCSLPPTVTDSDTSTSSDALRALLRLALVRGLLADHLLVLQVLMAVAGWGAHSKPPAPRQLEGVITFQLVSTLIDIERTCEKVLIQNGLALSESASLGGVVNHPLLGMRMQADSSSRATLLSSGAIEASSAVAVLTAILAQGAVGTVWGVGPWEHDFRSLESEPPPDEIATSVVLAAQGDGPVPPLKLRLQMPICVDVSPQSLRRLFFVCADALEDSLLLAGLKTASDSALLYSCLALLRLLKVHLHYVSVCRLDLAELGLDLHSEIEPGVHTDVEAPIDQDQMLPETLSAGNLPGVSDFADSTCFDSSSNLKQSCAVPSCSVESISAQSEADPLLEWSDPTRGIAVRDVQTGPGPSLVRLVRRLLLSFACAGLVWIDPATGNRVGEHAASEAIATLEVGQDIFFPLAEERRHLLLQLLSGDVLEDEFSPSEACPKQGLNAGAAAELDQTRADSPLEPSMEVSEQQSNGVEQAAQGRVDAQVQSLATAGDVQAFESAKHLQPRMVLADVMMLSFAQQVDASQLVVKESSPTTGSDGSRLLQLLVEMLVAVPSSEMKTRISSRCHPTHALALYSAILWGLLSRAALCSSQDEPAIFFLQNCVKLLFENASNDCSESDSQEDQHEPLLAMLPLVCSGLALLSSFTSSFANRLLPAVSNLCKRLAERLADVEFELEAAKMDSLEDFDLSQQYEQIESRHPYGDGCQAEHMVHIPSSSSCIWLLFDGRCSTIEGDASLELLVDGRQLHSFSGPPTHWPKHPVVIAGTTATIKFNVHGKSKESDLQSCWGFACRIHGFDPTIAPKIPVLIDCQKSVADLGAKYAASMIVGEPLSPEEHAHFDALENMQPEVGSDGKETWRVPGLSSSLLPGLLEKRHRRATLRFKGLEVMLQLLITIKLRAVRKHVLLHLAGAFKALQRAGASNKQSEHVSLLVHGCRGCGTELEERVRKALVQLFSLLASTLKSEISHHAELGRLVQVAESQADVSCLVASAHVFLLRFQEGDMQLLTAAGMLPVLQELAAANGRVRRLCNYVFRHLILCTFVERTCTSSLTSFQADVLSMLHKRLSRQVHRLGSPCKQSSRWRPHEVELDIFRLESLLFSLCARTPVRGHVCTSWLSVLMRLLKVGSERLAALTLRLLRCVLPSISPDSDVLRAAIDTNFGAILQGQTRSCSYDGALRRAPLLALFTEAIGREAVADPPLLALCYGEIKCSPRPAKTLQPLRSCGSPVGVVINGLISLLRTLQREMDCSWASAVGDVLSVVLSRAHSFVPLRSQSSSSTWPDIWLLLGALAVMGGHIDVVHDGGRAVQITDSQQSSALVVAVRNNKVLIYADNAEGAVVQETEKSLVMGVPEVEPSQSAVEPKVLVETLTSLLSSLASSKDARFATGASPLHAILQGQVVRAVHALLTSSRGESMAEAILGNDALPLVLQTAIGIAARFDVPEDLSPRPQFKLCDELALLTDTVLAEAAPSQEAVDDALSGSKRWHSTARLAIFLSDDLERDEQVMILAGMGYSPRQCDAVLLTCDGDLDLAQIQLVSYDSVDVEQQESIEKGERELLEALIGMGFSAEHSALALKRSGYDLHGAAEWLLEGGADLSSHGHEREPGGSTSAIEERRPIFVVGEAVEVADGCGIWHSGEVIAVQSSSLHIRYVGWCSEWDEWVPSTSQRLRAKTGMAVDGPNSANYANADMQSNRNKSGRAVASMSADTSGESSAGSSSRSRWFWRQAQNSSKRRASSDKATPDILCPSPDADFAVSDIGRIRVFHRNSELLDSEAMEATKLQPGRNYRITSADGKYSGKVGKLLSEKATLAESGTDVVLQLLNGHELITFQCDPGKLEAPELKLGHVVPVFRRRHLRSLFRAQCMLHHAAAIFYSRLVVLLLFCELGWLNTAHCNHNCRFKLNDLDPLLPQIMHVLKISISTAAAESNTDHSSMAWTAVSNLLVGSALRQHAPSFSSLPSLLANECIRFLARTATSVRQVESAHPADNAEIHQMLCCPGAGMMQLIFDRRSQLSKSAKLTLYLDPSCGHEIASFDSDDFLPGESLYVAGSSVWLHYRCQHNREHTWGFKVRAMPMRWRIKNEEQLATIPIDNGWDLAQLLVEEVPRDIARPDLLANFLRFLQHGRAPHKEKVVLLLLRCLPSLELSQMPFDWGLFQLLEQQVVWHEHLVRQSRQVDSAFLPCSSQCIIDLLVELREKLQACLLIIRPPFLSTIAPRNMLHASVDPVGSACLISFTASQACNLDSWASSLSWMTEIQELSALSKWLLEANESRLPTVWARISHTRQLQEVTPHDFLAWKLEWDEQLVAYAEQVHASTGSLLTTRPTQLASLLEQQVQHFPHLEDMSPSPRCFRFALLQRFNLLLKKYLHLVHTGNSQETMTLGGRICLLRGVIFMEVKQSVLEQALKSGSTETDILSVSLNRFRADKSVGSKARAQENSLFCQLYEQLRQVKPRTICRHDKAFRVNFTGEAADDHGGPYRESIAQICCELHSDVLPLFIRCPNGVHGVGENRDAFVPNPSACTPQHMEWFCFVGQLLGLALRQRETQLNLTLPSVVWKQLVGQPLDARDLKGFDTMCQQSLDKLRFIDREGVDAQLFPDIIFETFTAQLSDGSEIELVPNGGDVAVTFGNRLDFCRAVLHARLHESQRQCDAILQGMASVVPQRVFMLFTWQQLELLTCGRSEIDLDVLRSKTKYGIGVSPGQRHIRYFWSTLRRFTPEQRALFLRFVWGRTRLPVNNAEWGDVRFTLHTRQSSSPDATFPVAHTCFFSLELPAYSSAAICHEKLLYAITNCQAIDIDTTQSARENRDAVVEEGDM